MPTLSAGGLVSGIDTDSVVAKLKSAESGGLNKLQSQRSDRALEQSNLGTLATKLRSLQEQAKTLGDASKFLASAGTSTTASVGVTAGGSADVGTYEVKVTQLARATRAYSAPVSARDQAGLFGTGTLTLSASGQNASIDVTASDTLDSLAQKINGAGVGAKANVFYDGSTYRLSVSGTQTGAANAVTFNETGSSVGMTVAPGATAQDSKVQIDGHEVSGATNTVSNALAGVTLDLKAVTSEASATISVAPDPSGGVQKMKDFVTAYNAVVAQIKMFTTSAGKSSDGTALSVQTRLRATVAQPVQGMGNAISALSQIGVATQKDGTLTLNETTLTKALKDSPSAVSNALGINSGASIGVARGVENVLNTMLDTANGSVTVRQAGLAKRLRTMDEQISKQQVRLDAFEKRTRAQFNAMEKSLAQQQTIQSGSFFTTT